MNWMFWKKKAEDKKEEKPKSKLREWIDAIAFAVVAATLIRWLIMEAYTIPTPSMENSLLVGDFLFVSKFHYGTRTPKTPLQIPLTHQKIWFTDIPSYVEWIQLPQYRLPGFSSVKRNDVVVFNVPGIEENNLYEYNREKWIDYPVDLKTNYIKRCVGISGDVLEIKDQKIYINGELQPAPPDLLISYIVIASDVINDRNLEKLNISKEDYSYARVSANEVRYQMAINETTAAELKKLPFITSIEKDPSHSTGTESTIYPQNLKYFPWNGDNFGPVTIPKEGMTISINDSTLAMYGKMIQRYDFNENVKIENGKLFIDNQEVTEYTFKQNYYFMMGDNRHNSLDSRYWGFVPEDHIVGKAFFIWLSIDPNESFFNKIRWSRFFKLVE